MPFENLTFSETISEQMAFMAFSYSLAQKGLTPREIGEKIIELPQRPFEDCGGFENSNANTILEGLRLLQKQQDDQIGGENVVA